MPFVLIRGTYHVQGYQPDGDSIRFAALDGSHWGRLAGRVDLNARGHAQLRLEAIDTLETHYQNQHQPEPWGVRALDFLLAHLGIHAVQIDPLMLNVTRAEDGVPGYVLSREAEENGRPVAFAFAGDPPESDGALVHLDSERMRDSVNYLSLAEGLAYPTYYQGLFWDLRRTLTQAVRSARTNRLELWRVDQTTRGFDVPDLAAITERHVILPKLFRRLVEYLRGGGSAAGFKGYLEAFQEPILILSRGHFTNFDTVVDVTGTFVRLTEPPENIVFL